MCYGLQVASAEQSGTVTLRIDTAGKPAAAGTPVSSGIPFPIGAVATTDHLRLKTAQGTEVPANYRSLATWPDGSVKSALISLVPVPQAGDTYADMSLEYGSTVSHATTGPVQVTQDAQSVTVTNGLMKLQFSKQRFTILEQAWTDLDGDGTFSSAEQWLSAPADLVVIDKKSGNTFKSSLWTSTDGYTVQLAEVGPARVTLLLQGRLKGVNGAVTVDNDATLAQAKVWLSIFGGSPVIHAQTTVVDTKSRPTENFSGKVMDLDAVVLDLPTVLASGSYAAGGESGAVYQGAVSGTSALLQDATATFSGQFSYAFSYSGVGAGAKAPGWMDVSTASRGLTMGLRHFWQTYPHKLSAAADGRVQVHFVPQESPTSFWTVYPGVAKTYEGFLDLHAGAYSTTSRRRAELLLVAPLLTGGTAWNAASRVFGELLPPSSLTGAWETKMQNQYNCTVLRAGCSIYPQLYGQRDFGDSEAGYGTRSDGTTFPEYNDGHYEDAHGELIEYARDGNRGWFDYAVTTARHHYDLDVMHAQNPPRYPGFPAGMIHWHGTSEHEGVNIELGHAVPGGVDEYYYFTGDPRALEVIREQGDWVTHWARNGSGRIAPERSTDAVGWEEYERVGAWTLYTVIKAYEATGDPKYWEGASILAKNTIDWWKMPQDHIVFDPNRTLDVTKPPKDQALFYERTDWTQGTGYPLATLRVANCSKTSAELMNLPYQTHAPIAWMSGLLQMALIRYYEALQQRGGTYSGTVQYRGQATPITIDGPTMREMLIQLVKTVVDFTYLGGSFSPSRYPWLSSLNYKGFVYSVCPERSPSVTAGSQYLMWTLLYVSSFPQGEVSSLWQSQWPDMVAKWRKIVQDQYTAYVVNRTWGDTSANGAGEMLALPYAVARLESLGLLSAVSGGGSTGGSTGGGSTGGGTTTTTSSTPAYQVSTADGNRIITSSMVDLRIVAPAAATHMNISTSGFGQGTWQQIASEVHGFLLPAGSGEKTIYVQLRDTAGTVLASLQTAVLLLEPGFAGPVTLTLYDAADTYVFSNDVGSNFAAQPLVTTGKYDVGYDNIGLFQFALPALPAGVQATVQGAQLNLWLVENTRNTGQYVAPYESTAAWSENTATWNNRPALSTSAIGGQVLFSSRSEVNRWKTFALGTTTAQRWLDDPAAFKGVALVGTGSPGLTSVQFTSSESFSASVDHRPKLTLTLQVSTNDTTAPVITNVQAGQVGSQGATITWVTDEPADGQVAYGTTTAYGQQAAPQTSLSTTHSIPLNGLTPLTTYHVRVTSRDGSGNSTVAPDLTFVTSGSIPGDMNHDGVVTTADLPLLVGQLLGLSGVTPETADVNADGRVNIGDVQALANLL